MHKAISLSRIQPNTWKDIPLTQGLFAKVDVKDYEELSHFKWHAVKKGRTFYAKRNLPRVNGKKVGGVYMHKALLPFAKEVDHANRNGLDNRRFNLKDVTHAQNMSNRRKKLGASSKYFGVTRYVRSSRIVWRVQFRGKWVGDFSKEKEAAKAFDAFVASVGAKTSVNFGEQHA